MLKMSEVANVYNTVEDEEGGVGDVPGFFISI